MSVGWWYSQERAPLSSTRALSLMERAEGSTRVLLRRSWMLARAVWMRWEPLMGTMFDSWGYGRGSTRLWYPLMSIICLSSFKILLNDWYPRQTDGSLLYDVLSRLLPHNLIMSITSGADFSRHTGMNWNFVLSKDRIERPNMDNRSIYCWLYTNNLHF